MIMMVQALKDDDFIVEWSKEAMGESMKNGEESIQKASKVNKKERDDQVSSGESAPWEARRRALRVGAICDEACAEVIDSRTTKTKWENEAEGRKEAIRKIMESGGSWLHTWGTRAMGGHYAWSRMVGAPKSKAWRTGMALVCVGLLSTSAAQGVFFYKEQIAAYHPQVRPFMERACKAMGCLVGLVQAKSELDLDGAQVLLDDQGRLIFTATLKSRAEIESQAPRLWLALEGEDGEVVAARTIEAEKWLGEKSIKPGQELEAKMTFPAIKESLSGFKARLIWGAQG